MRIERLIESFKPMGLLCLTFLIGGWLGPLNSIKDGYRINSGLGTTLQQTWFLLYILGYFFFKK